VPLPFERTLVAVLGNADSQLKLQEFSMSRETYTLNSFSDIPSVVETIIANISPPPPIPELPHVPSALPQTQQEREQEIEKITLFFTQHPEVFRLEEDIRTWVEDARQFHFTLTGPDDMSDAEFQPLASTLSTSLETQSERFFDRHAERFATFVNSINDLNRRLERLREPPPVPPSPPQPPEQTTNSQKGKTRTQWYYYNLNGDKIGPFSSTELKALAQRGEITPGMTVENDKGDYALAKNVKGFTFSNPYKQIAGQIAQLAKNTKGVTGSTTIPPQTIPSEPAPQNIIKENKPAGANLMDTVQDDHRDFTDCATSTGIDARMKIAEIGANLERIIASLQGQ